MVDLTKNCVCPRCEFWDVDELPCLCSQPVHLNRAQLAVVTLTTGDVNLVLYAKRIVIETRCIEIGHRLLQPRARLYIHQVRFRRLYTGL